MGEGEFQPLATGMELPTSQIGNPELLPQLGGTIVTRTMVVGLLRSNPRKLREFE